MRRNDAVESVYEGVAMYRISEKDFIVIVRFFFWSNYLKSANQSWIVGILVNLRVRIYVQSSSGTREHWV